MLQGTDLETTAHPHHCHQAPGVSSQPREHLTQHEHLPVWWMLSLGISPGSSSPLWTLKVPVRDVIDFFTESTLTVRVVLGLPA